MPLFRRTQTILCLIPAKSNRTGINVARKSFRFFLFIFVPLLFTSCLVVVENQIEADQTTDERLVGVWVCVPIYEDPEVREKIEEEAFEAGTHREEDEIGLNGYLIFGKSNKFDKSDEKYLEILGIERFRGTSNTSDIIKGKRARTRSYEGRNYLLFELWFNDQEESPAEPINCVMEYSILEDGSLRLWFLYIDYMEDAFAVHKMETLPVKQGVPFSEATLRGTSDELLKFYSDAKVAKLMASAGRYKKLEIPANARVLYDGEE